MINTRSVTTLTISQYSAEETPDPDIQHKPSFDTPLQTKPTPYSTGTPWWHWSHQQDDASSHTATTAWELPDLKVTHIQIWLSIRGMCWSVDAIWECLWQPSGHWTIRSTNWATAWTHSRCKYTTVFLCLTVEPKREQNSNHKTHDHK